MSLRVGSEVSKAMAGPGSPSLSTYYCWIRCKVSVLSSGRRELYFQKLSSDLHICPTA